MRDSQSIRQLVPATRNVRILFYAVILGIVVGHVATLYHWAVGGCAELFARGFAVLPAYLFAFMPVAGSALMVLFLVAGRARVKEYVPAIIESSIRNTALRVKDGVVCFVTSLITLGSGGSAGPEGPMAYVGATLGEQQGRLLRLDRRHVKVLLAAGTAAGIAAIFKAPLAGVLFALELILLNDLTMSAVTPVILSAVSAAAVNYYWTGVRPTFVVPPFAIHNYLELLVYGLLGVAGGLTAVGFSRCMAVAGRWFNRFPWPRLRPVLGSLAVGGIICALPAVSGYGHNYITQVLRGDMPLLLVAALVVGKIVATACTLQSGNSGGIFAPSLLIGAALGATVGGLLHLIAPGAAPVSAFATVGMAAVMAGTIHAPLTALMLIFELTRDYLVILPVMTATVVSTAVAYGLGGESLYLVPFAKSRLDFRQFRDLGALADVQARELMRTHVPTIRPGKAPAELQDRLKRFRYAQIPCVDADGRLLGYVTRDALHLLEGVPLERLLLPFAVTVRPEENLYETVRKLRTVDGLLPVVDADNRLLGIVSQRIFLERFHPLLKIRSAIRSGL